MHPSIYRTPSLALLSLALLLGALQLVEAAPVKFRYPLNKASLLTTYKDNNPGSAKIDWNGGQYTYNGHEGTDFAQGKGTPIYAAADGTVEEVVDGRFDDCRTGACAGPSNRVRLKHGDGQITYYLHMKKWSIVVKKGQKVKCGQKLGEVASSGRSTGNHLHFQVGLFGKGKEPFKGKHGASVSKWTSQGSYGRRTNVPGTKCDGWKPECTKNADCTNASKPRCIDNSCQPNPPAGCPYVKTTRLGGLTLRMRSSTNTSSSVVGSIPENVCLAVIKKASGQSIEGKTTWYQVRYSGTTGWITAAYADCSTCGGVCANGATQSCYSGPSGTKGKGLCKAGTQTCKSGKWGSCSGQVLPKKETCNDGKDEDCDGKTDEDCPPPGECKDGETQECYGGPDGTKDKGVCKAGTRTCTAGKWGECRGAVTPQPETCDAADNNCNGQIDEGCPPKGQCNDQDQDGHGIGDACQGPQDCDDANKDVHPGAKELCNNQKDDNCDGQIDEGCQSVPGCEDKDGDGFKTGASCPVGEPLDCDDNHKLIYPGAKETCGNQVDEDCDGSDLPCKAMGEPNCAHDGECATRFCFAHQAASVCSKACNNGECPAGYNCLNNLGCWPKPPSSHPEDTPAEGPVILGCQVQSDCQDGEVCHQNQCQPKQPPAKGCGCTQAPGSPILPLFVLALMLWLFRKRRALG